MKTYGKLDLRNCDCMELMKDAPDNHWDLAICDPPYGIGISSNPVRQKHGRKHWDNATPNDDYFNDLRRVSRHQIIWGGNYFDLPPSQGFLIWDKVQPHDFSLAMCEYAWMSFKKPAKMWQKSVLAEKGKIHPTQKPVALYKWLLQNYAKDGDKILDTHLGSGSIAIACYYMGFDLTGSELDPDYYAAMMARIDKETRQQELF